jgi:hypothetical protein
MGIHDAVRPNARLAKMTKAEGGEVGVLTIHGMIVAAHCEKLFGGEVWPREQIQSVNALVQEWDEDQYLTAACHVLYHLKERGVAFHISDELRQILEAFDREGRWRKVSGPVTEAP